MTYAGELLESGYDEGYCRMTDGVTNRTLISHHRAAHRVIKGQKIYEGALVRVALSLVGAWGGSTPNAPLLTSALSP